jgi:hypothetical protein
MGLQLFQCPPPTALATVPGQTCPQRIGQIVRMFLMRRQTAALFTTTTVKLAATWTPLLTETDDTKVIYTPMFSGFTIPQGEILKGTANSNETINGIPSLNGLGVVNVPFQLKDAESAVADALRALTAESALFPGFTDLEAIFANNEGKLVYREGSTATDVFGFPIYNFVVGDASTEGFGAPTIHPGSFDLDGGWSQKLKMIGVTDFNPLTIAA